jgi:hypothetical protein
MMKKAVLVFLLCGVSAVCFARGNFELYGGMPISWDEGSAFGYEAQVQTTSLSAGVGFVSPQKNYSLGVFDEVIIPLRLDGNVDGEKAVVERDAYDQLIGMSCLICGIFDVYKNNRLNIPLAAGMRWMWLAFETGSTSGMGHNFGVELGIGAEYHISERIFLFGKVRAVYDFYGISTITMPVVVGSAYTGFYSYSNTTTDSGFISSWGVNPNIGIGFKL